jgi:hypothetical protein
MPNFDWKMIRKAHAVVEREITGVYGFNETVQANLSVQDIAGNTYQHLLPASHTLSRALKLQSEEKVSERVNKGNFFIANGDIVDFRTATSKKQFIHTDDNIDTLIEQVGVRFQSVGVSEDGEGIKVDNQWGNHALQCDKIGALSAVASKTGVREHLLGDKVSLSSFRDATDLHIPTLGSGGEFLSVVGQIWSPFKPHIEFSLGLVRLSCMNGMLGSKDTLVQRFQIINEWDHHLSIASQRFREDVHTYVQSRFTAMRDSRASLDLVGRAYDHVMKRTKGLDASHPEYGRAKNLLGVLDCKYHLKSYYRDHAFTDSSMRGALQSHLTLFDLWNCVTETDSYLPESEGSRTSTMQTFANELLLTTQKLHGVDRMSGGVPLAPFSSTDQAFFGTIDT